MTARTVSFMIPTDAFSAASVSGLTGRLEQGLLALSTEAFPEGLLLSLIYLLPHHAVTSVKNVSRFVLLVVWSSKNKNKQKARESPGPGALVV